MGDQTCVADAVHLAFAKRVRHTTRAMEIRAADFAWVVCDVWRPWRVIGDSFGAAVSCAGMVCPQLCVCDRSATVVCGTFQRFDLREKIQNKTNSLLNRVWSCQARLTLKSVLSLTSFVLNRSHHCINLGVTSLATLSHPPGMFFFYFICTSAPDTTNNTQHTPLAPMYTHLRTKRRGALRST